MSLPPLNYIDRWMLIALHDLAGGGCYVGTGPSRILARAEELAAAENENGPGRPLQMYRASASLAYLQDAGYVEVDRVCGGPVYTLLADLDGNPTAIGNDREFWGIVRADA